MTDPTDAMRALADKAIQADDGYSYSIPAKDLVEYSQNLRDASDLIEAHRKRLAVAEKTMRSAQERLQKFGLFDESIDKWLADYDAAKVVLHE